LTIARYLQRQLRTPLFALTVGVLVAAVVAVNAPAFGAIHALRWKALPYAKANELVELRANLQTFGFTVGLTDKLRAEVAEDHAHFAGTLGFTTARADEQGRRWQLARVTPEFSNLLGVSPVLGRAFVDDDARAGADAQLVLGDAIWRSRFNADPAVIGQQVRFSDRTYTVIGVMPRGFAFPDATTEAWRPYVMSAAERAQSEQGNVGDLDVVARLAPEVSVAQAQAALSAVFAHDSAVAGLVKNAGLVAEARAWRERFAATHWQALALFQLAALIVLAVVAANLVNLNLDRLLARAREFEIRRAIGAGEGAILRGVIADLALPAGAGLVVGLALTPFAMQLMRSRDLLPDNLPQGSGFDVATLGAGCAVALVAFACAIVAAVASRRSASLSSRAGIAGLGRVRPLMLIAQITLTTALLGCSGLLLRSAVNLIAIDPGFDARGVVLTSIDPVGVGVRGKHYDASTDAARFKPVVEALRADIASLPGIEHAAVASMPPFSGSMTVSNIRAPGQEQNRQARFAGVGPGYFAALGIGILNGREFDNSDAGDASPVVVDERYRELFLRGVDPLNAYVEIPLDDKGNFRKARIVGVARTVKQESLVEAVDLPTVYHFDAAPLPIFWLVTRASGDAASVAASIRERVQAIAPDADIALNKPLAELVAVTLSSRHALLELLGAFAAVTLALAAIGLGAVLSFAMRRHTGELGVRMALGATPARIHALVMRQGGVLIVIGAALGLGGGLLLARTLADRLYGVAMGDAMTWSAALLLIVAVAAAACWLPARRAANTDPVVALRNE
jgi:putative ABC transport system permease protein